jgi:hypothetical protein
MYTNISRKVISNIINDILDRSDINEITKDEILSLLNVILEQNYVVYSESSWTRFIKSVFYVLLGDIIFIPFRKLPFRRNALDPPPFPLVDFQGESRLSSGL